MFIVSIVSFKGGVGKSTTAVHLAASAFERGHRVLLVDLDFQASAAKKFMGPAFEADQGSGQWLLGNIPFEEAVVVARSRPVDESTGKPEACVHLIPGEPELREAELHMTMKGLSHRLLHYLVDLEEQGRGYDLVVIDTHPSDDRLSLNAVHAADLVISPFAAEPDAYIGPRNVLARLKEIERENRRTVRSYLLPTMYSLKNGSPSADFVAAVSSRWGAYPDGLVLPPIMDSDVIKSTVSFGQTMYEYRPGHKTTEQYDRILDIIQEVSYVEQ